MIYDWVIFSTSVSTSPLALRKLFASSQALAYTRKEHQLLLWDKEGFRAELFCFSHFKVSNKCILLSQPWKTDKWEFNFGNSSSTSVEIWDGWVRTSCSHHIWFYWLSMIRYRGFFMFKIYFVTGKIDEILLSGLVIQGKSVSLGYLSQAERILAFTISRQDTNDLSINPSSWYILFNNMKSSLFSLSHWIS